MVQTPHTRISQNSHHFTANMADVATLLAGGPAFEGLIGQLLAQDNDARTAAEAVFQTLKEHPDALVGNFLVVVRSAVDLAHRQFAAVMLKRVGGAQGWCFAPCKLGDADPAAARTANTRNMSGGA
jgi:hypothetical protein